MPRKLRFLCCQRELTPHSQSAIRNPQSEIPFLSPLVWMLVLSSLFWGARGAHAGEDADFRRARGYYTLQEYKLAVEAFEKYLADFPKAERAEQACLLLAESRYQLKQFPEAAAAYARFIKDYPASARRSEALLRAAKVCFLTKQPEQSLSAAETFLKENRPKLGTPGVSSELPVQLATALYYAGEDYYALKKPAEAKAAWEDLLKTWPDSKLVPDASEGLGWIQFDAKDYEQALARFRLTAAVPNHPRAAEAKLMEGRCLAALKKTDEALAAFKAALTLSGSSKELEAEAALRTAEVLLAAERYPDALAAYKRLAKDYPDSSATPPALAAAALVCMEGQHQAEALALTDLYLAGPATAPDRAALLRLKARALGTLNDEAEAVKAARKAVEEAAALPDPKRKAEEHPAALVLLAELSGAQGAQTYQEVVKLYPDTRYGLAARYELARLAGQAGKLDDAITQVKALLELLAKKPEDKSLAGLRRDALFAAGEFAFRKPDYKAAEEHLKAYRELAIENDPRADDVERKRAWCRQEAGDPAGAIQILDAGLKAFPTSQYRAEMLYLRASSAAKAGAMDDAAKFAETLVNEFPASPFAADGLYDLATLLYKQAKFDAAIAKLNVLLEKKEFAASPVVNSALQLRASARLQAGKPAEAQADIEQLLKKEPAADQKNKLATLRLIRALALTGQPGKEGEAEAALTELIQAGPAAGCPEVKQALLRRANLRFDGKKFAQAKEDFAALAATQAQPPNAEALDAMLRLALCHKELKETAEAKALFDKLSQQKLEGVAAFEVPFQLGNIAFEASDHAAAIAQYERALAAAAGLKDLPVAARSAANLNLAWSLKRSNLAEKAANAFAEVLKCDPEGPYVAEALYERGRLLEELNKLDEALQAWKETIERRPDSPQAEKALFLTSQSLAKRGRPADALAGFENYIKKYPAGPSLREAYCGLGECSMQAGNAKGARDAFNKVLGEKGQDAELDDVAERAVLGLSELSLKQDDAMAGKKLALRVLTERTASAWRDQAYFIAGQCSEKSGEPEKAIGYYRKLLAEHPKSTHAEAAQERLKALGAPK